MHTVCMFLQICFSPGVIPVHLLFLDAKFSHVAQHPVSLLNFLNPAFISLIYTNTLDHKIVRDFIGTYLIAAGLTSFLKTFLLNFW